MTKEEKAKYDKQYREANKERLAAYGRQYRKANKEKIAATQRGVYLKNKLKYKLAATRWSNENREKVRCSRKSQVEKLTDKYIKERIQAAIPGISGNDIPQELIEVTREHLRLKRLIKEKSHECN